MTPLAYSIRPFSTPNDLRPAAELTCSGCKKTDKLIISGFGNNPEKIEKAFIRMGWDANVHKARECLCPKCVRQREVRKEPVVEQKPVLKNGLELQAWPRGARDITTQPQTTTPREDKLEIKKLTSEQKLKLRGALDASFDDSTGRYTGEESDHTISERLEIPRALVVEFREGFYGELKEDPEIKALRDGIAQAKTVLTNLQSTIAKMETRLEAAAKKVGM